MPVPDAVDEEYLRPAEETTTAADPAGAGARAAGRTPGETGQSAGLQVDTAPPGCWNCGHQNRDPAAAVCVSCGRPLAPPDLLLRFADGDVSLSRGQSVLLGRPGGSSPHSQLFAAFDNVSKTHAMVGVGDDGQAWVRDEGSLNGTFVNGKDISVTVGRGNPEPLRQGDALRLAADATAQVRVRPGARGPG